MDNIERDEMALRVLRDELRARVKRSLVNNKSYYDTCRDVYRISAERAYDLLVAQNCNCAICQATFEDRLWVVDHSHKTGRVRGLLCGSCNSWLGRYEQQIPYAAEHLLKEVK